MLPPPGGEAMDLALSWLRQLHGLRPLLEPKRRCEHGHFSKLEKRRGVSLLLEREERRALDLLELES